MPTPRSWLTVSTLLAALCLAQPAFAQPQTRAYAPEDLSQLAYDDQVRVIRLEYSEQANGRRIPDDQLRFYLDQVNRSDWGFSRIKQDIARSLGGSGGGWGPGPNPGPGTIRCESSGGRNQTCATPWRGRSQLARQLSSSPCREGVTWGSSNGSVWVSSGCRGEFRQGSGGVVPPVAGNTIRCESTSSRHRECATPWRGQSRLVRQLSSTPCTQGTSWGSQPGMVWTSRGCRGEFAAGGGGGSPGPGGNYSVTCSSNDGRHTTCAWDRSQGRPYLQQQLSSARCIEGQTWGFDQRQGLWVNGGCRARFGAR